jgi:hypothetical protein
LFLQRWDFLRGLRLVRDSLWLERQHDLGRLKRKFRRKHGVQWGF